MSIQFTSGWASFDTAPVSGMPFSFACRYRVDAAAHEAVLLGLFNRDSDTDWATIGIGGGKATLRARSSASNQVLEAAAAYEQAKWRSMVGVFSSPTSRKLYDNGAAAVTQTVSVSPTGLNRFGFGRYLDKSPSASFTGYAAMLVMWNVELTDREAAAYISGVDPWKIRPQAIVGIWDGLCSNLGRDLRGQREPTFTNASFSQQIGRQMPILSVVVPPLRPPVPAAAGLYVATGSPPVETRAPVVVPPGKAVMLDWDLNPTTQTARIRINNGPWQSAGYQDVLAALQGDAVIGLPLVDGAPSGSTNNLMLNSLAAFARRITDAEWGTVHAEFAKQIPPIVPSLKLRATVGHVSDLKLLDGAQDAAGEGLRIVSVTQPGGSAVSIQDADKGIVSYDAKALAVGAKTSFSFVVTNKFCVPVTATATCEVTIAALQPPVLESATTAVDASASTAQTLDVLAAATDPAGRPISITSVSTPNKGGTAVITSGKIVYTPKTGYVGAESFTYKIKNDWGAEVQGTINVTVAAADSDDVLEAYDYLGMNYAGGQQGDISADSYGYRFSAAADGKLTHLTRFNQGARTNGEWYDGHAEFPYGEYSWSVYKVTALPDSSIGTDAQRTLIGGSKNNYYPGTRWGGFDGRVLKPYENSAAHGSDAGEDYHVAHGSDGDIKGPAIQAYNTFTAKGKNGDKDGDDEDDAPNWFLDAIRFYGGSWPLYPVYDTNGNLGIDVKKGDYLVVEWDQVGSGYSHDNSAHCQAQPAPGVAGVNVPMDPALSSFTKSSGGTRNRDWRKLPHYGQKIGSKWYGLPHMLTPSNANGTDETKNSSGSLTNQDAIVFYGSKYVRQVFTPPAGFSKKFKKAWVHLVRFTGLTSDRKPKSSSNNYVLTKDGVPQLRIMKIALGGTGAWTQVWPSSGWADGPAVGHFTAKGEVTVGVREDGRPWVLRLP